MSLIIGKVTNQTISLFLAVSFVPDEDDVGFGFFEQTFQGITSQSHPAMGSLSRWGALFKSMGGVLTINETVKNAVARGTAMSNGSFIDASNAFGFGATAVYKLCADTTSGHAVAIPV